ncbi:unnamed protein product [Arabis nemorensis]|uniref:Uncharacterized protein n=1 Tax=Arabis nemorensis TaxID=586526 RepID=A0A565BPE0_9BRAS|nr:unnamed protein product [Arabis nemorensis]
MILVVERSSIEANVRLGKHEQGRGRRQLKPSGIANGENSVKRNAVSEKASQDMDYAEELEPVPDEKEIGNEVKRESTLTSCQRALACFCIWQINRD